MASSAIKDITGTFMGGAGASFVPSLTGGAAAPSQAIGGSIRTVFGGDIVTGGSSLSKAPSIYWIGAGLLVAALAYKYMKRAKK